MGLRPGGPGRRRTRTRTRGRHDARAERRRLRGRRDALRGVEVSGRPIPLGRQPGRQPSRPIPRVRRGAARKRGSDGAHRPAAPGRARGEQDAGRGGRRAVAAAPPPVPAKQPRQQHRRRVLATRRGRFGGSRQTRRPSPAGCVRRQRRGSPAVPPRSSGPAGGAGTAPGRTCPPTGARAATRRPRSPAAWCERASEARRFRSRSTGVASPPPHPVNLHC